MPGMFEGLVELTFPVDLGVREFVTAAAEPGRREGISVIAHDITLVALRKGGDKALGIARMRLHPLLEEILRIPLVVARDERRVETETRRVDREPVDQSSGRAVRRRQLELQTSSLTDEPNAAASLFAS